MESVKKILFDFLKIVHKNKTHFSSEYQIVIPPKSRIQLLKLADLILSRPDDLYFERLSSYSQEVFKISIENEHLVLKVNKKSSSHLLEKELGIISLLEVVPQSVFLVPVTLGYYSCKDAEIILSIWVPESKVLSQFEVSEDLVNKMALATRLIQRSLDMYSRTGTHVNRADEACMKILKFSHSFMGESLDLTTEILESGIIVPGIDRAGSFSDRSAENWLYTSNESLYALDFGLTTNGHPVEDWITLIDSMRFKTQYDLSRTVLFDAFCSKVDEFELSHDHCEFVSLYRNIMQACLFYPLNREKSLWHFEKGIDSANRLSMHSAVEKISHIKNKSFG